MLQTGLVARFFIYSIIERVMGYGQHLFLGLFLVIFMNQIEPFRFNNSIV